MTEQQEASMDSPIRHLEAQGVMLNVFNQLQGLDDLVVCASVSKSWNSLVREARPSCLMMGSIGQFPALDAEGAACVLRWIQAKQKQNLQNLREFWLCAEGMFREEYEEIRLQSAFFEAAIMCTGFWNLQTCTLEGSFCLEQAVALLPTTLKHLQLTTASIPHEFHLYMLNRFLNLQLLFLSSPEDPSDEVLLVLDGTLPALRKLTFLWPFCITTEGMPSAAELQLMLSASSPCLVQASVTICATEAGIVLADAFLSYKGLKELEMIICGGPSRIVNLSVPRSSSLTLLRLVGPVSNVEISLVICKKSLEYECRRVTNVCMPKAAREMSKMQLI